MKHLLTILFIVLLSACSPPHNEPTHGIIAELACNKFGVSAKSFTSESIQWSNNAGLVPYWRITSYCNDNITITIILPKIPKKEQKTS